MTREQYEEIVDLVEAYAQARADQGAGKKVSSVTPYRALMAALVATVDPSTAAANGSAS